jgi:hypothetical protein
MTNIEKRVEKIVESLSVEKLVQFGIAQALSFDSHREWFLALCDNYDEVSAYMGKVALAFIAKIERKYQPPAASQKISRALDQFLFLAQLWGTCNEHVYDVDGEMLLRLDLLSTKQVAIAYQAQIAGKVLERLLGHGADAGDLLAKLLCTQQAVTTIRDRYFEGRPVIFKEYDAKLSTLIAEAEETALSYNKVLDGIERARGHLSKGGQGLPCKLDVDQIKREASKDGLALAASLVSFAESRAQAALGNNKRAMEIVNSELK